MTRIFLLRHGATAANREDPYRLQGRGSDLPLDETGLDQAERAAGVLASQSIAAVYSSPMTRAMQTGRAVALRFGLETAAVDALAEANVGRWEGLTWAEVQARDPDHFARFMADPGRVPYPEGESFLDVQHRVAPAVARLAAAHPGGQIVVVGHNVVNRAYLALLLGVPIDRARALCQANGGINVIEHDGKNAHVIMMNSCFHLQEL